MNAAAGLPGRSSRPSDKALKLGLLETLRLAWADEDIRSRLSFVLLMFGVYALGIHVPVPISQLGPDDMKKLLDNNAFFGLMNTIGGGAFLKLSVLGLGLGPYITGSIIVQVLSQGLPQWKQELQEGGEHARRMQNKRTRVLAIGLSVVQGFGLLSAVEQGTGIALPIWTKLAVTIFWMAGSMLLLYIGEQISERGIGNGVSLLIFAGIAISIPSIFEAIASAVRNGAAPIWALVVVALLFVGATWAIVHFSLAQRRIPIQHMRRNFGTKSMGGQTSYLPITVNMAGVIPVIFASALVYMPAQFAGFFPPSSGPAQFFNTIAGFFIPDFTKWTGLVAALVYMALIFGFTYFWNAMMYNVSDIADNLKKGGSYIPGVRPGKQTTDFLNQVVSRVTFVGALFLAVVALSQYIFPAILRVPGLALISGTSLLILVSVALETMRQIEANLLTKQYGS